jgi:hypothetical protein
MELVYMTRRIHTSIELNSKLDCWVPKAKVTWNEYGKSHQHMLNGPNDRFKLLEDAEVYAVEMAQAWIEADKRLHNNAA